MSNEPPTSRLLRWVFRPASFFHFQLGFEFRLLRFHFGNPNSQRSHHSLCSPGQAKLPSSRARPRQVPQPSSCWLRMSELLLCDLSKSNRPCEREVACRGSCSGWVLLQGADTVRWHRNVSAVAGRSGGPVCCSRVTQEQAGLASAPCSHLPQ